MVFNISKIQYPHFITSFFIIVIFSFHGCQKENDKPETINNPPVATILASPYQGEAPLESRIKVDGTDKDGKSDIARYSLEIKELGIDFDKKNPIDTTFTFSTPGEYTIKGTVRDKAGDSDNKSVGMNIS
ncbi:hypothetical protein SAMN05444280_10897 [Tangfeifania diversioriginum]|uniref:Uncharacterized protein n=1 Tax=Tangfeifania diversioriginum TaxID=1168035 RepID=A0A1M6FAS4_9BACT|nr:hypothetical protein [Tangfeifania diversioriginum]SHI94868.1 hypothetical protein SAMN05444280_10897 [Tangfeifania diversioriginum]